jgi:hypothetical protein
MTHPSSSPITPKRKSTLAALSLVFSCCPLITPFSVGSIAGTICGHTAMKQLKRDPELEGRQKAKWGLIIGYALIAISSLVVLFTILNPHFEW